MGVSIHFWALPPSSELFRRLQSEKPFALLMGELFHYGAGVFYFFDELDEYDEDNEDYENEHNEILNSVIARNLETFGSPQEAERWIGEFRDELDRTRQDHPGIQTRCMSLEKSQSLIEERLTQELQRSGAADAAGLASKLIYGERSLFQGPDPDQSGPWVISPELVREGAKILAGLDIHSLFPEAREASRKSREGWLSSPAWEMQDFERWRQFYRDVAAKGEALLVGVC